MHYLLWPVRIYIYIYSTRCFKVLLSCFIRLYRRTCSLLKCRVIPLTVSVIFKKALTVLSTLAIKIIPVSCWCCKPLVKILILIGMFPSSYSIYAFLLNLLGWFSMWYNCDWLAYVIYR
ncbi:uncharacterized protein EV154DRAFT_86490 [Mucor mucedo]|uniref:uncharacterized protein n=1 Tax=Mucor mucedo TaxID=29922 RepID=UPI00221FF769|nr:uncharacterized protein EV154DRAFT_86490 [Mucor mucedo]KAI7873951.1 hypothetical protein EV154DRAFT_86490 [Mucor mucedo]